MKNKYICFALLSCMAMSAFAQRKADNHFGIEKFEEKWNKYCLDSKTDMSIIAHRFFKDTVSVAEMKEAFFKYKDANINPLSAYLGKDSMMCPFGECTVLTSPLSNRPNLKPENIRGIWSWWGGFKLVELQDAQGKNQEKLLSKLDKKNKEEWMDGDFVILTEPRTYMGFGVSPFPYMEVYQAGERIARAGLNHGRSDFFSYAQTTTQVLDGKWHHYVDGGAKLMGALVGINTSANVNKDEKTFSVLLHEMPRTRRQTVFYTLELLSPTEPDKDTQQLFDVIKRYVEKLPKGTFKPYYTTDFRILPGRYYRVTVNKCGWLVEDYFK